MVNMQKAAVIGCGFVGSSSAFAMMRTGIFSELVLLDVNRGRAEGKPWILLTASPSPGP